MLGILPPMTPLRGWPRLLHRSAHLYLSRLQVTLGLAPPGQLLGRVSDSEVRKARGRLRQD